MGLVGLKCFWNRLYGVLLLVFIFNFYICVEIRRLSVPRWVQNGTKESVVLDCEYVWNENDIRLVVKWFFEDNPEPVYQWIPELNLRHISGVLRNRLDLTFSVNTVDAYSRFRALRISKLSHELSGKYTCLVTSLAGQDSKEQIMTVFVPAEEFDLSYSETLFDLVNVTCDAHGVYPNPVLKLYVRVSGRSPMFIPDTKIFSTPQLNGAYDSHLHRTFGVGELSTKGATVFECVLELPGTDYVRAKRIAYFLGVHGPKLDVPYRLASSSMKFFSAKLWTHFLEMAVILMIFK